MTASAAPHASLLDLDTENMLGAIANIPQHLRDGLESSMAVRKAITASAGNALPRALVVCGMGGSGVAADLLPAASDSAVPVIAVKGYEIPSWVSGDDAVVCMSYSGETSETLACFDAANELGVVAAVVTTGGELARRATEQGVPIVIVPSGFQPRAAVGLMTGALAGVAEALGVIDHAHDFIDDGARGAQGVIDLHTTADDPDGSATQYIEDDPPALTMARQLQGTVIVIYGAGNSVPIAHRWKAQPNENSKVPAFANAYPELDHNELVGWELATSHGVKWSLIELVPGNVLPALRTRMDITRDLIADSLTCDLRLDATSMSRAGAVFELVAWGDYISTWLALVNGIDPTPVARIHKLKAALAGA